MEQWGDASRVFNGNSGARLPESLEDSGNLERVPNQDGVGYQTQTARLVHDLLVISGAEFSPIGEKDPACQTVLMFTPIQLELDPVSYVFFIQILQDFTTRPSMVSAFAKRSEGELLANRWTITWAGRTRFLSEAATRTN
jgi:hypothetical protein